MLCIHPVTISFPLVFPHSLSSSSFQSSFFLLAFVFFSALFFFTSLSQVSLLSQQDPAEKDPSLEKRLSQERFMLLIDVARNLGDLVVALSCVGVTRVFRMPLNNGVVGSAGLGSALLGIYATY